jgi:hypothetical protein
MKNEDIRTIIAMVVFIVIIPFCVSVWGLLTSELFDNFVSIVLSDNKILGSLILSFMWIAGIGKISEFIRQSKNSRNP